MERTIFLFPDYQPEERVCREYVKQHYLNAKIVGSKFNLPRVSQIPEIQLVAVRRQAPPGKELTPVYNRIIGADMKPRDLENPIALLVPDVLESAPISVSDAVDNVATSLLSDQAMNNSELVNRLCDVFHGYRVLRQCGFDAVNQRQDELVVVTYQ
jgi:hypothetical protein